MMTNAEEMRRKSLCGNNYEKLFRNYHPMVTCFKQFIPELRNRKTLFGQQLGFHCLLRLNPDSHTLD